MKSKLTAVASAAMLLLTACHDKAPATYTLNANLGPEAEGLTAYIIDYDNGEKVDSALVGAAGTLTITGDATKPGLMRLVVDGRRLGLFFNEPGTVTLAEESLDPTGTPLNDDLTRFGAQSAAMSEQYTALPADSAGMAERNRLELRMHEMVDSIYNANKDNPLGYYMFVQRAFEMDLAQLQAELDANPAMREYKRVNDMLENLKKAQETSAGHMYKDFAIEYNDSTYRLSDYVGRDGKYTLVDFWASWCGPCIKETKTIKRLYERWGDKNLNVVGVAVWDEPDNTIKAVETHKLPWPQIMNAQKVPTDLYGISGIPCIILIDPNGRIVNRNLQGEELEAAVNKALEGAISED